MKLTKVLALTALVFAAASVSATPLNNDDKAEDAKQLAKMEQIQQDMQRKLIRQQNINPDESEQPCEGWPYCAHN